ncbi:MAG: GNAT family N-acetyltransferase [Prochlorococcaceae cyanobacterium]
MALHLIRPLELADLPQVIEAYHDAVLSQAPALYSQRQVEAWAGHAASSDQLRPALLRGHGLACCSTATPGTIEAFALLDPIDRLSLLYCRGRSSRRGLAARLVRALEDHAGQQGVTLLRTEASQLSRPLLQRLGWWVEAEEEVMVAGEPFRRWRMLRRLG